MQNRKLQLSAVVIALFLALTPATVASATEDEPVAPTTKESIEGNVVDVQTDEKGAVFTLYDSGEWYLDLPDDSAPAPEGEVSTLAFDAGGCVGKFLGPALNAEGLEWGAQNACAGSSTTSFFPHRLKVELRSTCSGFPCGILNVEREANAGGSEYNAVKTVVPTEACVTSTTYEYDQIAYPTVRGVQYGPFVSSPLAVLDCNINPD